MLCSDLRDSIFDEGEQAIGRSAISSGFALLIKFQRVFSQLAGLAAETIQDLGLEVFLGQENRRFSANRFRGL